jgi:hypothetical protein
VGYKLEDLDIDDYATHWLSSLESDDAKMRGLLDEAPSSDFLGHAFMMANIAPRAASAKAPDEALVLYAVLASFQNDGFPGRQPRSWPGVESHLIAAFAHANRLGRSGVARTLLRSVAQSGHRESDRLSAQLTSSSLGNDPGRIAAHEQELAEIVSRDVRAARLIDPSVKLDDLLLQGRDEGD